VVELGHHYRPQQLLPQRDTMLLLDAIDSYGADWIKAIVVVTDSNIFYEAGRGIPAWVGFEYVAQAASAFGGIEQVQAGAVPTIGIVLGMREYRCTVAYFSAGDRLTIEAQIVLRDEHDFVAYDCGILRGDERLARCTLKAYRPKDINELIGVQFGR
jgi:predicted hotdog family 3-hydroxylacyl-ACP dehydratase